ncbi:TrbC/VirB2 family protein [Paraburkholderia tropica]|uniref:TrbC/VirB2 family protein n=1 Tax=Paraburkholderia tropica TaxID=92647 RepID=UPI002AB68519|nr:TrbC/VirB2 family protein [Paraburkholderia tropica]
MIWRWLPKRLEKPRTARPPRRGLALLPVLALSVTPAWAQLSQVNTLLTTIQTTLLSVGAVVCSISIIWAGFKMMFQHARFGDIANVFIGGLFVGCATVIAAMLIQTS